MKLGLKRDEIKLVDHSPEWEVEFIRVKETIKKNTNIDGNHIEHISKELKYQMTGIVI